jgi:Rps23 Pro-64 3,4-dihydroxylase Tpa1-like proline 4-hydroxylase
VSVEIIQDIIPRSLCLAAEAAWPSVTWPYWHRYKGKTADKYGTMDRSRIPPACLAALDALALAAVPFIGESFIDYDLHAAGLHMLPPGGFLARHLDAECHPIRQWKRTHSIVLSVTSDWQEHYGGQLWIEDETTITPQCGTAVIFDTPGTPHEVLPVARQVYRKTLALFAWTVDSNCDGQTSANFGDT